MDSAEGGIDLKSLREMKPRSKKSFSTWYIVKNTEESCHPHGVSLTQESNGEGEGLSSEDQPLPTQSPWVQEVTCQLDAAVSSLGVLAGTEEEEKEWSLVRERKKSYFKTYYFVFKNILKIKVSVK